MAAGAVLVTGVEGMIGYAVAARLLRSGRAVVGMDRVIRDAASLGAPVFAADLSDTHALYGAAAQYGVDAVVHCGAISGPMLAKGDPYHVVQTNVAGTLNILEAARRLHWGRVVFCSSLMVYGANDGSPLREDATLNGTDTYGWSKVAAEALVNAYIAQHGVDAVSARLAWVYGPRRQTSCGIRTMLQDAMAGRPTRFASGAAAMRQYVHVDDVARALLTMLNAPSLAQRIYNVSGNDYRPFDQVADVVRRLVPSADIVVGAASDPEDPPMGPLPTDALTRTLGWTPSIALEDGIALYRAWLAEQP